MPDSRGHGGGRRDDEGRVLAEQLAEAAEDAEQGGEAALLNSVRHYRKLSEDLQRLLADRVAIEQAKGVVSERYRVDIGEADRVLRTFALRRGLDLADAAREITGDRRSPWAGDVPRQRD